MSLRKILALFSLTIPVVNTTGVLACQNSEAVTNQSLADKISSINALSLNTLKTSGIRLKRNFSSISYNDFLNYLGIQNLFPSNGDSVAILQKVVDNIATIDMANQFLFDISTKIPAYSWINQKLRWQASTFGLTDFINSSNPKRDFYNIMSGWMSTNDDWSLSVTFLTANKKGWRPAIENIKDDAPTYARININKRVVFDDDGVLDKADSNPAAIYPSVDNTYSAFEEITSNNGSVYQGLYYASDLIDISSIFEDVDDSDAIFPTNVVDLSITAFDWIDNTSQANINSILENRQQQISKRLTNWFEAYPIFLSEDDYTDQKEVFNTEKKIKTKSFMIGQFKQRLINQVNFELDYTIINRAVIYKNEDTLYKESLSSLSKIFDNIKYGLRQVETREQDTKVYNYDADILEQLNTDGNSNLTKTTSDTLANDDGTAFTAKYFLDNADAIYALAEADKLTTNQIATIMSLITGIIADPDIRDNNRDSDNYQHTEVNFNGESLFLTSTMFDSDMDVDQFANFKDISNQTSQYYENFTPLGLANDLKFIFYYYTNGYKPNSKNDDEKQLLLYNPDKGKSSKSTENSITRRIIKNVFSTTRIETLVPSLYHEDGGIYYPSELNSDNGWKNFVQKAGTEPYTPEDVYGTALTMINGDFISDTFDPKNGKVNSFSSSQPLSYWGNYGSYWQKLDENLADEAYWACAENDLFTVKGFQNIDPNAYNGLMNLTTSSTKDELTSNLKAGIQSSFFFGQLNSYGDVLLTGDQWYNYIETNSNTDWGGAPYASFKAGISANSSFIDSLYSSVNDGTNPYWAFKSN